MAEILSLKGKLAIAKAKRECKDYADKVASMDKIGLLEEMVRFHEEWNMIDTPALEMILKGIIFFDAVSKTCETEELRHTTAFYKDLLEEELRQYEQIISQ